MVTRSGWHADESLRHGAPLYAGAVKVVFVHHTAGTNDYACSDSPGIVRSIYAYHASVLGWNDIGYNFLVDKCGTVFEGRYGGTDRPVIGAHTYGFNTDSTGVAIIGTYTATGASQAALASLAQLAAWKLAISGINPSATSTLVEGASDSHGFVGGATHTFAAVSGHRDGYATECPGAALYAQLPVVRALATMDAGGAGLSLSGITGANVVAGRYYTTGHLTISWADSTPTSLLVGYTVLVDGRPAVVTAPDVRTAAVDLTTGNHTVAIQADRPATTVTMTTSDITSTVTTTTTSSAAANLVTATVAVTSDATAPTFSTAPVLGLRAGTVNKTGTPVYLTWRATDNTLLARTVATTPTRATFGPGTTIWKTSAGAGVRTFTLIAIDAAGNTRTGSVTGRTVLLPETAADRSGKWVAAKSTGYLDGAALASTTKNAALTWTFTGRSVAWIASRTTTSGQALIYLDGTKVGTVDLKAAATAYRQAVWTRNGLTAMTHRLKIVVVGTAHRPLVITDGITSLS
jgi:hypothetical protein